MKRMYKSFCALSALFALSISCVQSQEILSQYTLSKPFGNSIPGKWETSGTAVTTEDFIRLTPDTGSAKGSLWGKYPLTARDWSAELTFEIQGNGRVGADGMGLWYTSATSYTEGDVFGSANKWRGLLVTIDTFDNDRKHDNPKIGVIINDGTKEYLAGNDGSNLMAGGCVKNVRNTKRPAKVRVTYLGSKRTLALDVDQNNDGTWESCWAGENIDLPQGYYFGVTGATGGLSDNHDVRSFFVHQVDPSNPPTVTATTNDNNNNNNNNNNKEEEKVVAEQKNNEVTEPQKIEQEKTEQENEQKINEQKNNEQNQEEKKKEDRLDEILRKAENIQQGRPMDYQKKEEQQQEQQKKEEVAEKVVEKVVESAPEPATAAAAAKEAPAAAAAVSEAEVKVNDDEFDKVLAELEARVKNAVESNGKCERAMNELKSELVGKINGNVFVQSNTIDFKQLEHTIDDLQRRIDAIGMDLNNLISNVNKLSTETRTTIDSTNYMVWILGLGAEVLCVFVFIHFKNKARNSEKKMY